MCSFQTEWLSSRKKSVLHGLSAAEVTSARSGWHIIKSFEDTATFQTCVDENMHQIGKCNQIALIQIAPSAVSVSVERLPVLFLHRTGVPLSATQHHDHP